MKYNNNGYVQKVTPIEFLSDLEELESGNHVKNNKTEILSNTQQDKYKKYIRNESHTIAPQAGMNPVPTQKQQQQQQYITNDNHNHSYTPEIYGTQIIHENGFKRFNMPPNSPSCLDIAEHIANCPICSKFYNTDKTFYIIAIIVQAIICILLLKKILDI